MVKTCNSRSTGVKLLAAAVGGAATLTLGVLGLSAGSPTAVTASSHNMDIGQTTTETTPPTAPAVSMAVPGIKGYTPPSGFATTH